MLNFVVSCDWLSSLRFLFSTASTTENKVTDEVDNDNGHLSPLPRVPGILVAGVGSVGCHTSIAVIVIIFGRQVAAAPRLISTPGSRPGQCCPRWSGSNIETLTSHKISSYALNGWNITSNKPQISIGPHNLDCLIVYCLRLKPDPWLVVTTICSTSDR